MRGLKPAKECVCLSVQNTTQIYTHTHKYFIDIQFNQRDTLLCVFSCTQSKYPIWNESVNVVVVVKQPSFVWSTWLFKYELYLYV